MVSKEEELFSIEIKIHELSWEICENILQC